jgi:hypothetical protein
MTEREMLIRWVQAWKDAGPELERQRDEDVRGTDTTRSLLSLSDCFDLALRDLPPRPDSGLVEQQRWFRMLRA